MKTTKKNSKVEILEFVMSLNNNLKADWIKQAYYIKFKRKIQAKIIEYKNGKFKVEINNLSWDKDNFEQCKQQIIENYSTLFDALNKNVIIKIKNADNVFTYTYFSIKHHNREDSDIWYFHIIRENKEDAKAQLFTYPPKENDIISISVYPVDIAYLNSTGFTCFERGLFSDNHYHTLTDISDL